MRLQVLEWEGKDWINLVQNRVRWRALVNAVMSHKMREISLIAEDWLASQDGLCTMEFSSLVTRIT